MIDPASEAPDPSSVSSSSSTIVLCRIALKSSPSRPGVHAVFEAEFHSSLLIERVLFVDVLNIVSVHRRDPFTADEASSERFLEGGDLLHWVDAATGRTVA
jgi:hypothetical protein